MRIISGKFKGRKIFEPVDLKTRPLKDLTKESIFNIIKHSNLIKVDIENYNLLTYILQIFRKNMVWVIFFKISSKKFII